MRRILATLLLGLFSVTLLPAALFADADSDLPACCRRGGRHQCAMSDMGDENAPGTTVRAARSRCPMFPESASGVTSTLEYTPSPSAGLTIALVCMPVAESQAEALFRVSFARSRQKRGPPSFLS
jgi:hypothetical protein